MTMDMMKLRKRLDQRREALKSDQSKMEPHWRELRDYIQPFRGRFEGEKANLTVPSMDKILRSEALRARRTLSAGMQSGLTSPSRQWFKLTVHDKEAAEMYEVRQWCDEVQKRMLAVMAGSTFYHALHSVYDEVAVFGTGCLLIMPDYNDIISCKSLTTGTYYLGKAASSRIDSMYRDIQMTAGAMVSEFGKEKCSEAVRTAAENNPDTMFDVRHAIEPCDSFGKFPWISVYWEPSADCEHILRIGGYKTFPVQAPRWHVIDSDVYGYGPGSEALPDVKSLQVMERDMLEAVRKMVAPPLVADIALKGRGVKTSPNGITYVQANGNTGSMIAPLYSHVPLDLKSLQMVMQDTIQSINSTMYVDLFLMLQSSDGPRMTAREVVERHEEKMLALGPVLERLENELLTPAIERIFCIMQDAQVLPEPPEAIQGQELKIEYVSVLAQAQKMMGIKAIEQTLGFAGGLVQAFPDVLDIVNAEEAVREYSDMVGSPVSILRSEEEVSQARQQKAMQQQQMAQMQQAAQMSEGLNKDADTAQKLSQTDLSSPAIQAVLAQMSGGGQGGDAMAAVTGGGGMADVAQTGGVTGQGPVQ